MRNNGKSHSGKSISGKWFKSKWVFWVGAAVIYVVSVAAIILSLQWSGKETDVAQEERAESSIVAKLRNYEIPWDATMVKKWQDREGYPLDYVISYARYEVPRFESGFEVFEIGGEHIYTDDYNYELAVFHGDSFRSGDPLPDALLEEVTRDLIERSVVLQEGEKVGYARLYADMFNSSEKNYTRRNTTFTEVTDRVEEIGVSFIQGEFISVWFNNMEIPEMGLEAAQEYTKELIDELHEKIINGTMTFEEAGAVIQNDPVMIQIDPGLSGNGYQKYFSSGGRGGFRDPRLQEYVESMEEGEISDVILGQDGEEEWYDAFYIVVKVAEKQEGVNSYGDWLSMIKPSYSLVW